MRGFTLELLTPQSSRKNDEKKKSGDCHLRKISQLLKKKVGKQKSRD